VLRGRLTDLGLVPPITTNPAANPAEIWAPKPKARAAGVGGSTRLVDRPGVGKEYSGKF